MRETIEQTGPRLLFLPPYSPDFNPIEMTFSKLRALLRKAAARTADDSGPPLPNALTPSNPANTAPHP
ncbi:transposase [Acetobacteraceae bacterium H6797]|nr:transposase [Acetobacteraceae bacterium H6797]